MITSGGSSPYTTPRHSPSDGNSQRAASLTAASASASNARATPANTPAIHDSPNSTTHSAGRDGRNPRPEEERGGEQHDRLRREERDRKERLRRHVAGEDAHGADLQEARGGRVDGHDRDQPEPAADDVRGPADRPASSARAMPDSRSFAIAGAPRKAAVIARMKLNMNAARIRICDTPIRISSSVVPSAGQPGKGAGAPAGEADADDREREEDPQDPPAGRLADREPRDRDHGGAVRSPPGEQGQKALLERASSGVDLVDAPAGDHDRFDEVRTRAGSSGWISQSSSRRIGPKRSSWATACSSRPLACTRTPGSPRTSSSRPSSTTRRDRRSRRGRRPARPRSAGAS